MRNTQLLLTQLVKYLFDTHYTSNVTFIEPLELSLEKKYYLNVVKEITVTDSYLSMNKNVKGCQKQSYVECTTRKYIKALINQCQCLPFKMIRSEKVGKI